MPKSAPENLKLFWEGLGDVRQAVDRRLDRWLPKPSDPPARLPQAMRYSVFAGGKRIRPILAVLACRAVGGTDQAAMPAACSIECIHTYSLIHDDLPAMDDDDFRRGKPSSHKAFDEATAILAGDALLTFAFELLTAKISKPTIAARLVSELASASGWAGMVGGQMADVLAEGAAPNEHELRFIHQRKTAALIRAALRCGAISGGADADQHAALTTYAQKVGLAFQITDDILDVTATSEDIGKTTGKDRASKKLTFPAVLGIEKSRAEAEDLVVGASAALKQFGPAAEPLRNLAEFIVVRTS